GKPNAAVQNTSVLAADILSRWAPIAEAAGLDMSLWQEQFTTQLRSMPMDGLIILDRVTIKSGVDAKSSYADFVYAFRSALMAKHMSTKGNAKLGSTTTDQVFIPIVPCRVVDTRNVGGPVLAGFPRNFNFYAAIGTYNWASQGGTSGN